MATKKKTWAELIEQLNDTLRKWGRTVALGNALPAKSRQKRNQTDEERTVTIEYSFYSSGRIQDVRLKVLRESTATENLALIATALEMIRMAEVRGVTDLLVKLYRQMYPLPPAADSKPSPGPLPKIPPHYAMLHLAPDAPLAVCEASYRALARTAHPDQGGSTAQMQRLNLAIETIRKERA